MDEAVELVFGKGASFDLSCHGVAWQNCAELSWTFNLSHVLGYFIVIIIIIIVYPQKNKSTQDTEFTFQTTLISAPRAKIN